MGRFWPSMRLFSCISLCCIAYLSYNLIDIKMPISFEICIDNDRFNSGAKQVS